MSPMQGYILNINRVKDEDLIVSLLTEDRLLTLYRFYGARHANINLGYKLDFEAINSGKSSISMLRNVLHLGDKWMATPKRFFIWQHFIKLLYKHLKDIDELDSFYFELLNNMNKKFEKQNPVRVVVESYIELLSYEGRLHDDFICFSCEEPIKKNLVLARSFLPAHYECIYDTKLNIKKIKNLFKNGTTIELEDDEVNQLWKILQEGF
jgi:recombinational DNA repair protein (RecF pathway)